MKYVISTIAAATILATLVGPTAFAATASVSATPTAATTPKTATASGKLEDLKERLATKVAQLRQTQRKALAGIVKEVSLVSVTIETETKDVKIELTDDVKVIQILKGKRTTLTTSDLAKGDRVVAFGQYDGTLDLLKAKILFIQAVPLKRVHGIVSAVDSKNFTVTLTTADNKIFTVDVEKETKVSLWSRGAGLAKAGFSKLAVGDTVWVAGSAVPKKDNRISADRVTSLGNLSGAAPTPTPTPEPTKTASPSATPKTTSTPKATPTKATTPTPVP